MTIYQQAGLFASGAAPDDPALALLPPALAATIRAAGLDRNRQAIILAELATGRTPARHLARRVAALARAQAQDAAAGDQPLWKV